MRHRPKKPQQKPALLLQEKGTAQQDGKPLDSNCSTPAKHIKETTTMNASIG